MTKKREQPPSQGDDASTAKALPGRVGRDEHGEAHRANTTPNGGPHLELLIGRLRLITWSKSDFLIAETTWPTYPSLYLYSIPSIVFALLFLSLLVVTQIRGHAAGSSAPSSLRFVPCILIARRCQICLSSSTRVELCLSTLGVDPLLFL